MEQVATDGTFDNWAVVELMGHVRMAGRLTEQEMGGGKLLRIDVPGPNESFLTQYFGVSAIYRMTPCSEEVARTVALHNQPKPIYQFELLPPAAPPSHPALEEGDRYE